MPKQTKSSFNHHTYYALLGAHLFMLTTRWMDNNKAYYHDDGDSIFHKGIVTATILKSLSHIKPINENLQDICEYIKAICLNRHHPNYLFLNGFIEGARRDLGIILDSDIPLLQEEVIRDG